MDFVPIDVSNIRSVKNLHAGIFPVLYSDKFFEQNTGPFQDAPPLQTWSVRLEVVLLQGITCCGKLVTSHICRPSTPFQILNNDLCAAVMLNGTCIGVVCCKFEFIGCTKILYIMSLGVHPLYRCRGIGAELVNFAISKAVSHCVPEVRLHVQVSNFNAINFYSKRGFSIVETAHNYYHRCIPADAHMMHKLL